MQLSGALFYSFAISRSLESVSQSPSNSSGIWKSSALQNDVNEQLVGKDLCATCYIAKTEGHFCFLQITPDEV